MHLILKRSEYIFNLINVIFYSNWKTNQNKCPLFLYQINSIDKRWPIQDNDCQDFLHKIQKYTKLKTYINYIGKSKFQEVLNKFEHLESYGINVNEILTMDLTLIHRKSI